MKKILTLLGVLVVLIILLFVMLNIFGPLDKKTVTTPPDSSISSSTNDSLTGKINPHAATFIIDGKSVDLRDGKMVEESIPNSSSTIVTTYFGNDVAYDFDGDGRIDNAFLITQNTGGTGTFYYEVVALNKVDGTVGSQAYFVGDRIAPQSSNMDGSILVVNYADRKPGDAFTDMPSVGKSLWLKFDPKTMQFGEVVQNFEGEADPAVMKLDMQTWKWISLKYSDGKTVTPNQVDAFKITFKKDGTFSATTDCNGVGGNYSLKGFTITFDKMVSTLMYCDGSQEADFTKALGQIKSYHFTSKGELIFDLKMDSGTMLFK